MGCCFHYMTPSTHEGYEVCHKCGSFHSIVAPPAEELYTSDYWTHERNHSTADEQVYNCEIHEENGKTKNQFILDQIEVEDRSAALEIGCSPGALLPRLQKDAGFKSIDGCDPCGVFVDGMWKGDGWAVDCVHLGYFPAVSRELSRRYSLIVACDVFEHSHKPWPFLAECARLLKKGGQLILMLPLVMAGAELPERMFHATEHVWIHSARNLIAMLQEAGFNHIRLSKWTDGHEVVSAIFEEVPTHRLRAS